MGLVKFYARYIIFWLEKPLFQYGAAHVLGPHRRFDKDLWSSFSASGQKHSLWQHVMKNGNHLDKQHGSWGLWKLVLINHGGKKLISITSAKRFIQTYAAFWNQMLLGFSKKSGNGSQADFKPYIPGFNGLSPGGEPFAKPQNATHFHHLSEWHDMDETLDWWERPKVFSIGEASLRDSPQAISGWMMTIFFPPENSREFPLWFGLWGWMAKFSHWR